MKDNKKKSKCSICNKTYLNYGHNPQPFKESYERCCDECNKNLVIPARIKYLQEQHKI